MPSPAKVICITPVRNEAWVLERFLTSASVWADRIVVADQRSDDESREIARRFPKVTLIENGEPGYHEGARQRLLIEEARKTPGRRLIVALDADEALSGTAWLHDEWQALRQAPEGTVARFEWVNLLPGLRSCWIPGDRIPFAFVDDGTSHLGERIHSTRVPAPPTAPVRHLDAVKVLHFQHVEWLRMKSKQRWYQCWEMLNHPGKRPVQIYRQYHRMDAFPPSEIRPVDPRWIANIDDQWRRSGTSPAGTGVLHWDQDVLEWLLGVGPEKFRRLDIWDVDWTKIASRTGRHVSGAPLKDPRSPFDRAVHAWLRRTQPNARATSVRVMQRALIPLGW